MQTPDSFARGTLDTLPFQIAVLDSGGDILLTNRAWDEFVEGEDRTGTDWQGTSYVGAIDRDADEHAQRAYEGIRQVLDGERDLFRLEYPCHSPTGQQWFLMRASPFELGNERGVAVAHIDITERKLAELEADDTAERLREEHAQLEHLVDRINGLVQDVTRIVVSSESRNRMETEVCETFAATDPYVAAWTGHIDLAREQLRPQVGAGPGTDVALADVSIPMTGEDLHPSARAVVESEPQIVVDPDVLATDPVAEELTGGAEVGALAALPLTFRDNRYGVLTLYVGDAQAVDDRECVVLAALGRILTHGINARETKRNIAGTAGVEMTVQIGDADVVANSLSAAIDGRLDYRGSIHHDGEEVVAFFTLEGADPADLDPETVHPGVRSIDAVAVHEDTALIEVTADSFVGADLAEFGATLRDLESEDGRTEATVELAGESSARSVYDLLTERYDDVDLLAYHERDRPEQTAPEFQNRLTESLTTRQLTVLQKAYLGGYYESSREVTGTDLAESMGISRATFHQHLRAAERKVMEEFFEG